MYAYIYVYIWGAPFQNAITAFPHKKNGLQYLCQLCRLSLGEEDAVAESVEHWSREQEIVSSNPSLVKPITYQINICRFLARCSALL